MFARTRVDGRVMVRRRVGIRVDSLSCIFCELYTRMENV